jgi:hypothetical protein
MTEAEFLKKLEALAAQVAELKKSLDGSRANNEALGARVKSLEPKPEFVPSYTPERFDPMEGLRIPRDAVNALVANVGDDLVRDIVGDHSPNLRRK